MACRGGQRQEPAIPDLFLRKIQMEIENEGRALTL
jgi:hypothetical protein